MGGGNFTSGVTRIMVTGSRDWDDVGCITEALASLRRHGYAQTVIHGGARGADEMAGQAAQRLGYGVKVVPADWDRYGKRAGILRNLQMLEEQQPEVVLAFRVNGSRGTTHAIEAAKARDIPVELFEPAP